MTIERINDNKIKIILTLDELEKRDISLKDIEKDGDLAKELFMDLIEESNLDEDFVLEGSQLLIEATSDNNNLFTVTITKIENIPELSHYATLSKKRKENSKKANTIKEPNIHDYKVSSYIYSFDSIDTILSLCNRAKNEKLFFGKNSLYLYEDTYFLIFSTSSIKNKRFKKTFVFLSEYCKKYSSYDMLSTSIKEKAKIIIENNALQKLSKI